jgi:transketolase
MASATRETEQLAINTIRTLAMDAVQQANSGHPGTPMALAPVAYVLWNRTLRYDPASPLWPGRDRFVLSCGHASMLLYALLHLAGVKEAHRGRHGGRELAVTLEDLKKFRQLGSPCAGHPEYGDASGVETTTGPLGQGVANSVGMAVAARWLAARYHRPGFELFNYNVFALCSDGDLMEGIGAEAASLAGHLQLSNLCWIYDDNHITIEGKTDLAFSENIAQRFEGLGWNVLRVEDANDLESIEEALAGFARTTDRPTLIAVRSVIGYGSPNKANSHEAHGAPLGAAEIRLTKEAYGWPADQQFLVPAEVCADFAEGIGARGKDACAEWHDQFRKYQREYPEQAAELKAMWSGELPADWEQAIPVFATDAKGQATRVSSGQCINAVAARVPWFLGGSADLAPSNNTLIKDGGHFSPREPSGRNLHFGVREHAMAAAANGLALSGLRPYCGTFFVFTDYLRPAMRLSALMQLPVLYILTHDSIGLGEDGPTHQPVEHLAACRAIPHLFVFRPGDANEVAEAYRVILRNNDRPAALVLSRQNLPTLDRTRFGAASGVARGAYILSEAPGGRPEVILIGTGSEVSICLAAQERLHAEGIPARVVSMPCWELFDLQEASYRESVLPPTVRARIAVEAGVRQGWDKYLGDRGGFVGMSSFGKSGPFQELYAHFQ